MSEAGQMWEASCGMASAADKFFHASILNAKVEGMKAENEIRKLRDETPAYFEDDFARIASEYEELYSKL